MKNLLILFLLFSTPHPTLAQENTDPCKPLTDSEIDQKISEANRYTGATKLEKNPETIDYVKKLSSDVCFFTQQKDRMEKECTKPRFLDHCLESPILKRMKTDGISVTGLLLHQAIELGIVAKLRSIKKVSSQTANDLNFHEVKFLLGNFKKVIDFKHRDKALKKISCDVLIMYSEKIGKMLDEMKADSSKTTESEIPHLRSTIESNLVMAHRFCD